MYLAHHHLESVSTIIVLVHASLVTLTLYHQEHGQQNIRTGLPQIASELAAHRLRLTLGGMVVLRVRAP